MIVHLCLSGRKTLLVKTMQKYSQTQARSEIVDIARLCYERRYICGMEGNFSIRLEENLILTTPAGVCKGKLTIDDLVLVDLTGAPKDSSGRRPSTELKMHLTVYQNRRDVKACVHAHPTYAVGFSVAGVDLNQHILPEVVTTLGKIPLAPYATPSTDEVSESIAPIVKEHDSVILDHHGALTYGPDLWDAFYKLETIEHHAHTLYIAHTLGGAKTLAKSEIEKLMETCATYGISKPKL